jgi:hypothetical protein
MKAQEADNERHFFRALCAEEVWLPQPEFSLEMSLQPKAYTFADKQMFVTFISSSVGYLEEDELRAVAADEIAHFGLPCSSRGPIRRRKRLLISSRLGQGGCCQPRLGRGSFIYREHDDANGTT